MNEEDFNNLVESIHQAAKIQRGERVPSRVFDFETDEDEVEPPEPP
jgi:hypothetical protein